jgi:pyrroline-5-carboxylate reductase
MQEHGVPADVASSYAGSYAFSVSTMSRLPEGPEGLKHLVEEQTKGGINEGAIRILDEAGAYTAQKAALEVALSRLDPGRASRPTAL